MYPLYRDPVYDFGILRFDPTAVHYIRIEALDLKPENARVGVEIRMVGNDAAEKLSILSGVISRLDCNAPEYGDGYNDFNTNYIQAAAAASDGSSGSPVVTVDGCAVALQAGGRDDGAATNFFLPLNRPLRALEALRKGESLTRGTIQCQWYMTPFDVCRRLGLPPQHEEAFRKEKLTETNMLVAKTILPGGPADGKIKEGDVLLKINGELLTQFTRLDEILDSSVGQKITILIQRCGKDVVEQLNVGNLHAITPDRFITFAGATFHDLSYQQARRRAVSVRGVYVCEAPGEWDFYGLEHLIVQMVDNKATPDMDCFIEVVKAIPDQSRVIVKYREIANLDTLETALITVDRHWNNKIRLASRNNDTGL